MATDGTIQDIVTNYHHSTVTTFLKLGSGQSVWHNHPGPVAGTQFGMQTDYRGMSSGDYTVAEKSGGWSYALHEDGSYWGIDGRSGRIYQYNFEGSAFEYTNKKY